MKKTIALFLMTTVACTAFVGCIPEMDNSEMGDVEEKIIYNGVEYEEYDDSNFNLCLYEDNASYIGDYLEGYDNGYVLPWEVYALNKEANVLYSPYTIWVKPGYEIPDNFGVAFSSVEYVVSEGIDFLIMEDNYTEEATLLATFDKVVKLEDIVEAEASEITGYVTYDDIRFKYTDHADMASMYTICGLEGKYYLNISQAPFGTDEWHEIKPEYVDLLTSTIEKAE